MKVCLTQNERYLINGRKKKTVYSPESSVNNVIRTEARGYREDNLEEDYGQKRSSSSPLVGYPAEDDVAEETTHEEEGRRGRGPPAVVAYEI